MPTNPFVTPKIVRLTISTDDWIDVKAELSIGEIWEMYATMRGSSAPGDVDPTRVGLARVLAYLLAWSFVGPDGQPADITEGNIRQLNQATFKQITAALDAHETHVEDVQDAEKNGRNGATAFAAISPSAA